MNARALFLITHGSSDRRSWIALQDLIAVAKSRIEHRDDWQSGDRQIADRYISGGCLEGLELTLSQQLEGFATQAIQAGISEVVILPLFLLEGVHVSEDIPAEVAIAQNNLQERFIERCSDFTFRITPYLGTDPDIPKLISRQFEKYRTEISHGVPTPAISGRILIAHGSRRAGANQVIEDLAKPSQAIAAYWGVEPKIETQIEKLLLQGIEQIQVLPYFLNEGGITEAISRRLQNYSDRAQIQLLPVPLSKEQIIDLAWKFI
ncbi:MULTISPECIES: sirohydrochlorin chelatase [Pseudanabaena]|uniref:Cobalamin (Vitamin B12) biosynthesis CbiX protein n=2 Tax=Pseudanabaena TaxID=1152 RepID=L8MR70_9CYAN|nr:MULTISPECIES: CbiX/SirB N-terminal domain-containing protein [Pseudanabaena]ELS30402.1 cobalamin (vitamin B12) biosynthesis CbiX protein [Pseudanabaena biceps PCC 7429]MDG3497321.1 CbiX/SirB N-terminal domain-containing protein [Pseudanabaena catenata USMAC16]